MYKMFFSRIFNYQNFSVALSVIISVGLQLYQEHKKLPKCASGTSQRY